jgi:iron complex outermembrane receptor protein/hemoglobin/transferrin/lactoferrin receptor protein
MMRRLRITPTAILLLLIIHGMPGICQPRDTLGFSDTIHLEDIVVVGNRVKTKLIELPEAISLMNSQAIESISPMNMPDAMHAMAGVFMQKTNNGGGSPFLRGLTGYHTLILVDGIRLNNAIFRSGPNQYLNTVDPLMLEQIEVLRGPGSVQYGTDAIGGTIDLRSAEPLFSTDRTRIGGKVYGKWLSHGMEKTGHAELSLSTRKVGVIAGFSRKVFGNIRAGGELGVLDHTSYDEYAANVKSKVRISPSQVLTLAWQHHRQNDVQLYHQLVTGEYTTYAFDPQVRDLLYLRHEVQSKRGWFTGLRTTLSLHQSDETRKKQKTGSNNFFTENDRVDSYGLVMEFLMKPADHWNSISGYEIYYDLVRSHSIKTDLTNGTEEVLRGLYPDQSNVTNLSVFSLHSYERGKFRLNGGIRYNHFLLGLTDEVFGELSLKPHAVVGSLGASYRLFGDIRLSFTLNNAFRAPNINDVSSFGIADFRYEVPNFNLSPEKSLNKEIGIKTDQKRFSAAVYLYHNGLKDLMVNVRSTYQGKDSIDGVQVYTRENVGKAFIRGVEGELVVRPVRFLTVHSFLIYTYGQNVTDGEPLRRIPPLNGLAGIHLNVIKNLEMIAEWQFAARQDRLSSGDLDDPRIPEGGTPAWNVFNIRASYYWNGFRMNAGLINLLDKAYRTHGSGVDEMGRSIYLSLQFSF